MFECNGKIFRVGSNSKAMKLPSAWGLKNGDWLKVIVEINGKSYINTLPVRKYDTSPTYITCDKSWNCEVGDSFYLKCSFANVPVRG